MRDRILNVLVIADPSDMSYLKAPIADSDFHINWKVIRYDRLGHSVSDIEEAIKKTSADLVMYSRNEQVADRTVIGSLTRRLRIGYSSFSAIDQDDRIRQMAECYRDFVSGDARLDLGGLIEPQEPMARRQDFSFSIAVDVEQLGGVKYGLPRVLQLLRNYRVQATFYVTNLMNWVYPGILEEIYSHGHEIGLHGQYHEYLCDLDESHQFDMVRAMIDEMPCPVVGANLIGRMNDTTIGSLHGNGIRYFVIPRINPYRMISYPRRSTNPASVKLALADLKVFPISVDTYGHPWSSIRNMVATAINCSLSCNRHVTILIHDFREGALCNMRTLERMLKYLVMERNAVARLVKDVPDGPSPSETYASFEALLRSWHTPSSVSLPKSRVDLCGFIPESIVLARRLANRNRLLW